MSPGLNVDKAVVEHRGAPQVRELLAGQLVDVGAAQAQLAPPHAQAIDHAQARTLVQARLAVVAAAVVVDSNRRAVADPSLAGVLRVYLQQRFARNSAPSKA